MARPKKTDIEKTAAEVASELKVEVKTPAQEEAASDGEYAELMRLYPQYERFWVTPKGFVHPYGAPSYLLKGAKLIKNEYFKNKQ